MANKARNSTVADACQRIADAHGVAYVKRQIDEGKFGVGTVDALRWWRREQLKANWFKWLGGAATAVTAIGVVVSWFKPQ